MSELQASETQVGAKHPAEFDLGDFSLQLMRTEDNEEAYRIHEQNRQFWATHLDYATSYTAEKAREDFERAATLFNEGKLFSYWIIRDGEKVGDVGMTIVADGKAELGYKLVESAQGQGLATRAAECLKQYGFEQLGLQTIDMLIKPANEPSKKVAERLGARVIGQTAKEFNGSKKLYDVWEITK